MRIVIGLFIYHINLILNNISIKGEINNNFMLIQKIKG